MNTPPEAYEQVRKIQREFQEAGGASVVGVAEDEYVESVLRSTFQNGSCDLQATEATEAQLEESRAEGFDQGLADARAKIDAAGFEGSIFDASTFDDPIVGANSEFVIR